VIELLQRRFGTVLVAGIGACLVLRIWWPWPVFWAGNALLLLLAGWSARRIIDGRVYRRQLRGLREEIYRDIFLDSRTRSWTAVPEEDDGR